MNRGQIVRKRYSDGLPFVTVRVVILNPHTNRQTTFDQRCWVDTGFTGGVSAPDFRLSEARMIDVEPRPTTVRLAGGDRRPGHVCLAFVQRIENHDIPPPGIEIELLIRGEEPGCLGLEVLRNWVTEFDGPKQILSMYKQ